jgi:hypothetical protein
MSGGCRPQAGRRPLWSSQASRDASRSTTHLVTAWWKLSGPGTVMCVLTYLNPAR